MSQILGTSGFLGSTEFSNLKNLESWIIKIQDATGSQDDNNLPIF